jgi:hypothetical protein
MNLLVPLSLALSPGAPQLVAARFVSCYRVRPGMGEGQETTAVLVLLGDTISFGMLCTKS